MLLPLMPVATALIAAALRCCCCPSLLLLLQLLRLLPVLMSSTGINSIMP
jgi:hypothetical protein